MLLAGCARIPRGMVVEKEHHPAHTTHWIYMMPVYHSTGKTGYTTFIPIPMTSHYPEQWSVTIVGPDKKGKQRTRTVYVPKSTFDELREGDNYCVKPEDCNELQFTKERDQ